MGKSSAALPFNNASALGARDRSSEPFTPGTCRCRRFCCLDGAEDSRGRGTWRCGWRRSAKSQQNHDRLAGLALRQNNSPISDNRGHDFEASPGPKAGTANLILLTPTTEI